MVKVQQKFIAQVATLSSDRKYTAAGSGIFDPGEIAVHVLPNLRGGQLFAYLFRRFGYPTWGWDDYKELTHYLITTPLKGIFLEVRPYMGSDYQQHESQGYDCTELMFGYCIEQSIEEQYLSFIRQGRQWEWEDSPDYKKYVKAFEVAMHDLLRPVYIRDIPINCYGRIKDESFKGLPSSVEPYHAAGYPIPKVLFKDVKRYEQFWDALRTLGQGNAEKGMDALIKTAALHKEVDLAEIDK